MFEIWATDYDQWAEGKERTEQAVTTFKANDMRPIIPADELARLKRWFASLDSNEDGWIDADTLMYDMDLSKAVQDKFLLEECQDGFIDEQNFLRLMCPPEYRLSEMDSFARSVFGQILNFQASQAKTALERALGNQRSQMEKPAALRPVISSEQWKQWEAVFEELDKDKNEIVTAKDMVMSNVLSEPEAKAVTKIIDPDNSGHFSKADFMKEMLKANDFREVDPSGDPV
mmetsp:Transcript_109775/g.211190  ORF Transcript_109775/g.211190 Transcript_109775/m.211190 type:complete len:230 (+) Transcript_109775:2-691(+)